MNSNLYNIIKRIVTEKGENILADPQKLNPLFKDYAKDEAREERVAFGRCIEIGAYHELKNTINDTERKKKKVILANQLNVKTGMEKKLCTEALDILEAVIFNTTQLNNPQYNQNVNIKKTKVVSKKTLFFGIAGILGSGVGSIIGWYIAKDFTAIMNWTVWTIVVAIGISLGLLIGQSIYLKNKPETKTIIKTIIFGLLISAAAGAMAGFIVALGMGNSITRIIGWGVIGVGIGIITSLFIPNFPKKRAIVAGVLGGVVGCIVSLVLSPLLSSLAGVIIGDMVLGLFIGLSVSIIEEALREAWINVIWGKNETRTITLGSKPIVFGSSSSADIYLTKDTEPSIRATVQIENSKVVMYDKKNNQRRELQNGEQVDFSKLSFVVNIKKA